MKRIYSKILLPVVMIVLAFSFMFYMSCVSCSSIKEDLQNFDISGEPGLNYRDFAIRLKEDSLDASLDEYKVHPSYTTADFNQLGLPYYDNVEIMNDIKYFNNTSAVLHDFQNNNILSVEKVIDS